LSNATNSGFLDLDRQTQFARHNLDNLQALIRFSDTKAGVLIALLVFLAGTGIQAAKEAIPWVRWTTCAGAVLTAIFVLGCACFLAAFVWSLVAVQAVIRPRGAAHYRSAQTGRDLMWQDHVIAHGSNEAYFEALRGANAELILRNVSDQVFELSHISKAKMEAFNASRPAVWLGFFAWATILVSSLLLVRWK